MYFTSASFRFSTRVASLATQFQFARKLKGTTMTEVIKKRPFLIDCDAGIDDAGAILMALSQCDIDVVAITTCHGNINVNQVTRNVLRILQAADRLDIPVYKGASTSLLGTRGDATLFHGLDGLGDVPDKNIPDESLVQKEHAVNIIVSLIEKYKEDLTVLLLGPHTNMALALRMDPEIAKKVKSCFIMGGNYKGVGNITPNAEFNFHCDPEAARVVLQEFCCPITVATWELSLKHRLSWDFNDQLRSSDTKISNFLRKIESQKANQSEFFHPCDELAMACAINPSCILKSEKHIASVECNGEHTRGQLIIDHLNRKDKPKNVIIVKRIDVDIYSSLLRATTAKRS